MSIRVVCPSCRTAAACPDEYRGRSLRCKKCGRSFLAGPPAPRATRSVPVARGRLVPVAVLAVVLVAAIGVPVAYFLLTADQRVSDISADAKPGAVADTHLVPAPSADTGQRQSIDRATKPTPVAPVAWQEFASPEWGFRASFPAMPQATSPPSAGGRRSQVFTAPSPRSVDGKQALFSITCTDCDPRETSDAAAVLAAATADLTREANETTPIKLGVFPGVELRVEQKDAGGGASIWLTLRRIYLVRSRLYALHAGGPREAESSLKQFLDSFRVLDVSPANPVTTTPSGPVVDRIAAEAATTAGQAALEAAATATIKHSVADLLPALPPGWDAHYNKFLGGVGGWVVRKAPPTARSDAEELRIEECPADARTPVDYTTHLKRKDFLNVDVPGWVEVGGTEELPDGFVIKGVVKKPLNAKAPPTLGLVAVRDIGGIKVRCYSANLRNEKSRDEALELFKSAGLATAK